MRLISSSSWSQCSSMVGRRGRMGRVTRPDLSLHNFAATLRPLLHLSTSTPPPPLPPKEPLSTWEFAQLLSDHLQLPNQPPEYIKYPAFLTSGNGYLHNQNRLIRRIPVESPIGDLKLALCVPTKLGRGELVDVGWHGGSSHLEDKKSVLLFPFTHAGTPSFNHLT